MNPRDLRHRSLARFLSMVAIDWAIVVGAFAGAAWLDHWAAYVACWFVIGTRQHALGILGHEGSHGRIHKNRRINDTIAKVLCFWPIFQLYEGYTPWHIRHHRHLGTEQDSENAVKSSPRFALPTSLSRLVLTFAGDLVGLGIPSLMLQMEVIRPADKRALVRGFIGPVVMAAIAIPLLVYAGLYWVPLMWFAAMPTSFWAVFRVREFFEHTGTKGTHRYHIGPIGRFCFAPNYIWVHYEHHKWPFIPCFRLLEARKLDTSVPVLSIWELIRQMEQPELLRVETAASSTAK